MPQEKRQKGKVKWYQVRLGYGFITGEDGNDYFVHHSEIQMGGFRKLKTEQNVEFIPNVSDKGKLMAEKVVLLS